jgi:Cu(I)/Ag(I) efflux system membrane fusion protein
MSSHDPSGAPAPGGAAAPGALHGVPLTRGQKFRMVVKVVELRLRFILLLAATGLVFAYWDTLWNYYDKWTRPAAEQVAAASDTEYYCPMHPSVVRDEPGSCPICGMPLSKRKKGEAEVLPEGVTARVQLAPFRIAQAGIRTAEVAYAPLSETVTTVGYVTFDERRLARISSKVKGMSRVEELHVNFEGTAVEAGEPLAELYSPELYQAVQELLLARRSAQERPRAQTAIGRSALGDPGELVRLSKEKLRLWGITPEQVDRILAAGRADVTLPILAPIGGVVVGKNVVEGQYVAEGEAMFEVADLSHVWIQAQVYEDQLALVRVGQAVEATVDAFPGEVFSGTVAFIDPVLNPATRTVDVRYDLPNADGRLRPGMYATVTLKTPVAETPVFRTKLASARGRGDLGDRSRLTVAEQETCLVTDAKLGSMGEPVPIEVGGKSLWMCCAGCEEKLRTKPDTYLAKLSPPPEDGVLSVPESAVIDTGSRTVVYVEAEPGVFEGREVVLGPPSAGRYPVLEGLAPGEQVAAAGAFLIDAETRLNPAAGAAYFGGSGTPRADEAEPRSAAAPRDAVHRH